MLCISMGIRCIEVIKNYTSGLVQNRRLTLSINVTPLTRIHHRTRVTSYYRSNHNIQTTIAHTSTYHS
ncbi:hypothetical protein EPI10_015618 [Gossypium australe]|uniref:Uncharacterized protein n=1 Tax=Gossypium australe TaxID=47621 RepID=A0A5B6VLD8_9ROSI|nr:hypothetical protein EPI10_015618 [Gossypium australe]